MRNRFVHLLLEKHKQGQADRVVVLTGDLGFSVLEPLQDAFGERFINVGIAEALMASAAAGLAREGFKVFIYSITPFATFRCLEQIRNDICYHNVDVTVVGVGAGYGYGALGATHHALEDVACLWSLPNMNVYSPADVAQTDWAFEQAWNRQGPSYLRLGKGGEGTLASSSGAPSISDCADGLVEYSQGKDLTIVSTGHILADILPLEKAFGTKTIQILSVARLKPFPSDELVAKLTSSRVVVIEELNPYGGFSGHVAKAVLRAARPLDAFEAMSTKDQFAKTVGSAAFQRKENGLDTESLRSAVQRTLEAR